MLDPRIYRAGLIPALLALVIAAFSIEQPPPALTAALPPDSFNGTVANASLRALRASYPSRRPGSAGDRRLASHAGAVLRASGFEVRVRSFDARTAIGSRRLQTVTGVRAGTSSRRIVVVAHRDALEPGAADALSGTAALLELARVFRGRTLNKTLVFVSTSGGSGGAAGATEAAAHLGAPIDGVIVLGDLAGKRVRRPLVVPWSNSVDVAPQQLRRTVAAAVALESGLQAGDSGPAGQFARLAFPLTVGEQGALGAAGLPAVLLSVSGERGPGGADAVDPDRFTAMGRAVLRSITALDNRSQAPRAPRAEVLAAGKLAPGWAVRLLVGALILPVAMAAIDGFARVRRRRHPVGMWIAWVLSGAAPFAVAVVFAFALVVAGLIATVPPSAAPVGAVPLHTRGVVALVSVALVIVLGWLTVRPLLLSIFSVRGDPGSPGAAAALTLVLVIVTTIVWVFNPFAAVLLLPALHAWMLLTVPEVRIRRSAATAVVILTLLPAAAVVVYYAVALGLGPGQLAWTALLLVVGGHLTLAAVAAWCVLLGCLASVLSIIRSQGLEDLSPPEPTTRGPLGYAGPGSLGGTRSALRR